MKAREIVCLSVLAWALGGTAGSEPTPEAKLEPQEIAEAFLEQVGRGEVDKAWDAVPKGALWVQQAQKSDMLRGQIKTAMGLYGRYLGIERVRESRYSPSLSRLAYLMKCEQHYFVWTFVFYRPADRWELSGVFFVDQPNGLE